MRGYFEIGVFHSKSPQNIGTLWRSAFQLGAAGLFTVGRRYTWQPGDTVKAARHVPLRHYLTMDEMLARRPIGALLIGIEMGGRALENFRHPEQAVYLLGAEDHGLPPSVLKQCNVVVSLGAIRTVSYNVAVAGSLVMYHRVFSDRLTNELYFQR